MFIFINGIYNGICDVTLFIYNIWILIFCRLLIAFLKKLFRSSDTKCSSDIFFSFSSIRTILCLIVLFSENKGCIFFQKLVIRDFFGFILSKYTLCSFSYDLLQYFFCFLYFFKELGVLLKYNFSKYDLLVIAFLSAFVTYSAWFAHST